MMSASAHVINGILAVWLVEILIIIKMNKWYSNLITTMASKKTV
jgi:hypothetical protein